MDEKFKVPATTFLAGFFLWLIFIILGGIFDIVNGLSVWVDFIVSLIAGGFIVYSAFSCRAKGGPRVGSIVRLSVLIVMSGVSYWLLGLWPATMLLIAALSILPMLK